MLKRKPQLIFYRFYTILKVKQSKNKFVFFVIQEKCLIMKIKK